jgi:DNA polymerase sigma
MNSVEKKVLDKFKMLLQKRAALHKIILFGSRARGNVDPQSDMDVVVIIDEACDEQTRDCISDCAWEAGFEDGIVVVPVVYTRNEWENGPESQSLLVQAVKAEGIPI